MLHGGNCDLSSNQKVSHGQIPRSINLGLSVIFRLDCIVSSVGTLLLTYDQEEHGNCPESQNLSSASRV